jgi:hypothetical protein
MSHVVELKMEIKITNRDVLDSACRRIGIEPSVHKRVSLFNETLEGTAVQLDGWRYPIVIDTDSGVIKADNYHGRWGRIEELKKLENAYQIETVFKTARDSHRFASIEERELEDGALLIQCVEY